jgi:TusA-related sulfurtransferase
MSNRVNSDSQEAADYYLDITREVCPLTFVRTKLLIERMAPGEIAVLLLRGAEPLANIPRALSAQRHELLELRPLPEHTDDVVYRLRFRKAALTDRGA